jgi:hypothetical protein
MPYLTFTPPGHGPNCSTIEFYDIESQAETGREYRLTQSIHTAGRRTYLRGTIFVLKERTFEAPFGWIWSEGNWVVEIKSNRQAPGVRDIWSSIEIMIAEGTLVAVKQNESTKTTAGGVMSLTHPKARKRFDQL